MDYRSLIKRHITPTGESAEDRHARIAREAAAKELSENYKRQKLEYLQERNAFLSEKKIFEDEKHNFNSWCEQCKYHVQKSFSLINDVDDISKYLNYENKVLLSTIAAFYRHFAKGLFSAHCCKFSCGADLSNALFVNSKNDGLVLPSVEYCSWKEGGDVAALIHVIRSVVIGPRVSEDILNSLPHDLRHLISLPSPMEDASDLLSLHHPFFLDIHQKMEFLIIIRFLMKKHELFYDDLKGLLNDNVQLSNWTNSVPDKYKDKMDAHHIAYYNYLDGLEDPSFDKVVDLIRFICNLMNHINDDSPNGGISREDILKDFCDVFPHLFTELFIVLCQIERTRVVKYWWDLLHNIGPIYGMNYAENRAVLDEKKKESDQELEVFGTEWHVLNQGRSSAADRTFL